MSTDIKKDLSNGPALPVVFSVFIASCAESIEVNTARTILSVSAPLLGYFLAWLVKECESIYQRKKITRRVKKHKAELQSELQNVISPPSARRKKELEEKISNCDRVLEELNLGKQFISST